MRILFVHNTLLWYRVRFFQDLARRYCVRYVFTHMDICKDLYGVDARDSVIEFLKRLDYNILNNYVGILKPNGIAFGLVPELFGRYDVLVGGSWDSPAEVIETVIFLFIAKLRGKPVVLWREDWGWNCDSLKDKFVRGFARIAALSSDRIIVPGTAHKRFFISLGARAESVFIMPNVSNTSLNNASNSYYDNNIECIRTEFGLHGKKVILYVGRLIKRKGVHYLMNAFQKICKEMDDVRLVVVGRGEERQNLESLSKELGIDEMVHFAGYVADELLPAYYLLSNIVVVPSISLGMGDPWVFTLNEAMHFGRPVIATDATGAAFDLIIQGRNGYRIPERDVDSLFRAMKSILSDEALEARMGVESKEIIESGYRYDDMCSAFCKAIESLNEKKDT